MYSVYVLFSPSSGKHYVGYTSDIERRLEEHNVTGERGFTIRYRPWTLVHTEAFESKTEAIKRELYFKTGKGRDEIKRILSEQEE